MAQNATVLIQDPHEVAALLLQAIKPSIDARINDEVFTVEQAAAFMKCTPAEITRQINAGQLPAKQVGGGKVRKSWRVKKSDLLKF